MVGAGDVTCNPYSIEEAIVQIQTVASELLTRSGNMISLEPAVTRLWVGTEK